MAQTLSAKRIVITGASGVGKTSLANLLKENFQLPIIPEVAREICQEKGYSSPTEIPDQEDFRRQVLDRQLAAETASTDFIADRSAIDAWVMWQRWQICSAMTYTTEAYYEQCRAQAQSYTHIIYIPPLFKIEEDQFRWTEPDYIKQIDRLTRLTLFDWELWQRSYTIESDQLEMRLIEVEEWLRE